MEESVLKEPTLNVEYGKIYTYADYLSWNFKERIEILKGKIFKMSPAPARMHQRICINLISQLLETLKNQSCQLYTAPFDVRLIDKRKKSKKDEDIITVFQPDLCVICDESKLDDRGCIGAPDLIIEILSPSNSKKEMKNKYELYEENDVREYWMVDYFERVIFRYVLENEEYRGLKPITEDEKITSHIFPNMSFEAKDIFKD